MKKTFRFIIIFLFFFASKLIAQIPEIITKTDYSVSGSETLIASQSIILKPNSWIKSGSTFTAKISHDAYIPFTFSNENYIFSRLFQRALTNSSSIANNADVIESIVYYDGLGRPMQNIAIKASPSKKDIVTHISYDNFGRSEKEYLPYMDTSGFNGTYRTRAEINTSDYYKSNYSTDINTLTPNPFSQKEFERSPLNRVFKQAAPGKDWAMNSGHEIKLDYLFNSTADGAKLYTVTTQLNAHGIYEPSLASYGVYGENELYKTIVKNENWISGKNNTTEEFTDKLGRIILKRTYANYENPTQLEVKHDTYYVYDNYDNLTYVLPPKADGAFSSEILNEICYQYKYDCRNRLAEKKLPGKDWEYIVYDKLDRPVLTQDVNLRASSKWMFTKYDAFNRPVYTGEFGSTQSREALQTQINGGTTLSENRQGLTTIGDSSAYYSNLAFPNTSINLYTVNYYDDYGFDLAGGVAETSGVITPITNAKGLATGSKVRTMGTTQWTTTVQYYDAKGRSIYTYIKNDYLSTVDKIKSTLDFTGKVTQTENRHNKGTSAELAVVDSFEYDHAGRLLTQKQAINGATQEIIASNNYNSLGQLQSKGVGGKTIQARLQTVDYTYNIRGWLKGINNATGANNTINLGAGDLFGFQINYNNSTDPLKVLFNGNISQTLWKTNSINTSANPVSNTYTYNYDALNRLTSGIDNTTNYNESLSYDKNGNIMSILRKGNIDVNATTFGTMDNLTYTYDVGNKLTKVDDTGSSEGFNNGSNTATEYTYDVNGNMKTDNNKSITSIIYNYLNLPTKIVFNNSDPLFSMTPKSIEYVYDATGAKLSKKFTSSYFDSNKQRNITTIITTDYAGRFIYENGVMKFFSQPEGYAAKNVTTGNFDYIYQYKDHLGNIRLSYGDGNNDGLVSTSEIVEENNYYPFGLKQKGYNNGFVIGNGNATAQKYKYNGKELQDELGLNFYDYGARNFDPALGRWMNIDPLAETSRRFSPYTYCLNNPIFFIDPDGMIAEPPVGFDAEDGKVHTDSDGSWIYNKSSKTWVGQKGSSNIDNRIQLNEVIVQRKDPYEGTYFDKDNRGSGEYGAGNSSAPALALCSILAAPIALEMGGAYLLAELAGYSSVTAETAIAGVATNTLSQGIVNGGDFTQVNGIEALSSAIPGIGPTIVGETFSYNYNDWYKGNGIQTPKSFEHAALQIGGGFFSNKFGNKIDANPLFGSGVGKTYGKVASFAVETGTNVLPSLADKTQKP